MQKEKREQVAQQIESLKAEYEELANTIQRNNNKIVSMTEELAISGRPSMGRELKATGSTVMI